MYTIYFDKGEDHYEYPPFETLDQAKTWIKINRPVHVLFKTFKGGTITLMKGPHTFFVENI